MKEKLTIVVFLLSIHIVMPFNIAKAATGKRLGVWAGSSEFSPPYYTAEEFFNAYFLTPPYFAFFEPILDSAYSIAGTAGSTLIQIAEMADDYSSIEIAVMCAFDMGDENEWDIFISFLENLKGKTSIYSVGIDGEHATYGGTFPDKSIGNLWNTGQISNDVLISIFDRAKSEVELRGFEFVNYYLNFGDKSFRNRYTQIGHTNFPCFRLSGGDPEYTLDWQTESWFIGQSAGLSETHALPDDNHWNQEAVNTVIEHGVAKSDDVRRFIGFATGSATQSFTGVSGKTTNFIWDNPLFRQYVWDKVQQYQSEFILSTSPSEPPAPTHTFSIYSSPINGVSFTINGISYVTSLSTTLSEGTYTVSMPESTILSETTYYFKDWEDNSTNPTRTINLSSNMSITAYYDTQNPTNSSTKAQLSIAIQVIDLTTKQPVKNASIQIRNQKWISETKHTIETGWVYFSRLTPGTYTIVGNADEYAATEEIISIVTNTTYTLQLSKALSSPVTVSVPEFDSFLIATALGVITYLVIKRKLTNKKRNVNQRFYLKRSR